MKRKVKLKALSNFILDWCFFEYGESDYQETYPILEVIRKGGGLSGEYDSSANMITIYCDQVNSAKDLTETIIHEYQHFLQCPEEYEKISRKGIPHKDHPLEIIAENVAQDGWKSCIRDILYGLNHGVIEEMDISRTVSGNIGDPETDKELDLLRQGLQLGELTPDDLDVLQSIVNHNFRTPATNASLAIQSEDGGELEHRQKIIDALKDGKQRIDDLLRALAITP